MGADKPKTQALRKRQQIEDASKSMFVWVAGAAIILGICAVLAVSLYERIVFRQTVINAKNETVGNLKNNVEVADNLKKQVRILNTNRSLGETPRLASTEPLSVILDALPSNANSSAVGASLQQKLLNDTGVSVESLTVLPIAGVEDVGNLAIESTEAPAAEENVINFQFTIVVGTGQANLFKEALRRLERSVRTIDITAIDIEQLGSRITLSGEGRAFYQPATKVELKEKSLKP